MGCNGPKDSENPLGDARLKHWRIYAKEGLARCKVAALWLGNDGLTVEYAGQTLSRYDISLSSGAAKLEDATNPRLFVTKYQRNWHQLRLFGLDEGGWLKALKLDEYAAWARRCPQVLQQALFPYLEAL